MKKKLIIAAVGAALAAGAMVANAAPTVYGKIHVSVDKYDSGGEDAVATVVAPDVTGNTASGINISSNSSRVGVKGTEDLGGGLAAAYQAEFGFNADENGSTNQRNTFVGLAGGFGTVLAGRHDTPYKIATGALDPFGDTVGDYNGIIGSVDGAGGLFDLRVDNALAYVSPSMGGVTVIAAYTIAPAASALGFDFAENGGDDFQDFTAMSVAALYGAGPLSVSVAYETHDLDKGNIANTEYSHSAMKVGAGYDFGVAKVALVVENTKAKDKDVLPQVERQAVWAAGTFPFGNSSVSVAFGKADESETATKKDGATMIAAGFFHNFSKTTKAYVVYASMDNDENANYNLGTSGHGDIVSAVANKKATSLSVGMSVDF